MASQGIRACGPADGLATGKTGHPSLTPSLRGAQGNFGVILWAAGLPSGGHLLLVRAPARCPQWLLKPLAFQMPDTSLRETQRQVTQDVMLTGGGEASRIWDATYKPHAIGTPRPQAEVLQGEGTPSLLSPRSPVRAISQRRLLTPRLLTWGQRRPLLHFTKVPYP